MTAALQGNLKEALQRETRNAEKAVTLAIRQATEGLKLGMRQQVIASGLGQRMANTWRGEIYPKGQNSIRAAGLVFTKASKVMAGFEDASVIRSKDGWWLAIPAPSAPKRGVGGQRISPSNFPVHRYGPLRFVYRSHGPSLLVVENMRASSNGNGFRKASERDLKTGQGLASVVMFWLVPKVQMPKLIRFAEEAAKWYGQLPDLILKNWPD